MKKSLFFLCILVPIFTVFSQQTQYNVIPGDGNGLRFWNNNNYKIHMGNTSEYHYGPVTDYSIKSNMNSILGRGWTWGVNGSTPIAGLNTLGDFQLARNFTLMGELYAYKWIRVKGNRGLYFQDFGGGFHMIDNAWIRTYGNKNFYHNTGIMRTDGEFQVGLNGNRFLVKNDGNIGMGTTNPQEKLHLMGNIRGNSDGGSLRVNTGNGWLDLGPKNSSFAHIYTDRPKIIFNKDIYTTSNAFSSYNNDLILKTKGTERLRINDENGNIGIGTNQPYPAKLHIKSVPLSLGNEVALSTEGPIQIRPSAPNRDSRLSLTTYNRSLDIALNNAEGLAKIRISSTPDQKLHIEPKVSIGTYARFANGFMLSVDGKVIAEEIQVQDVNQWPDYVFEDSYDLMTLDKLEQYIEANNHLPNIPSAKEVKDNDGIKLGEMNTRLLEKVEELSLYIIDLHKRIEKLENEKSK